MNLQPVDNQKDSDADKDAWRNSHVIRFSQIDGAGIVYYPRYFEMLADSFPQQFAVTHPAQFNISFHQPVRLGEQLLLETATQSDFTVNGKSAGELCFALHKSNLDAAASSNWPLDASSFVRQVEVRDWMTGADARMHLSRSYELTAVLMEEWFTNSLQCPFATTQSSDGVLVPTVKLQSDVYELPSLGDIVQVSLVVLHIGRSSLGLGMSVLRNGRLLIQTRQTIVFVAYQNAQLGSVQIPSHLLSKLKTQLVAEAS